MLRDLGPEAIAEFERRNQFDIVAFARRLWARDPSVGCVAYGLGPGPEGEGTAPSILIFTGRPVAEALQDYPAEVLGVPVHLVFTGEVRASMRDSFYARPTKGGVSAGVLPDGKTGTFACVVYRREGSKRKRYILSCAHVFAWDGPSPGDWVVQPSSGDDPSEAGNEIGEYVEMAPFDPAGVNIADAAIARPFTGKVRAGVVGLKTIRNWRLRDAVQPGLEVVKSGRSDPEIREGRVIAYNGVTRWQMPGNVLTIFRDVIVTELISDAGDSGALVVAKDADNSAVGMVCATSAGHSYLVSMERLRDALGVTVSDRVWPN